jgi:hypothetical protein
MHIRMLLGWLRDEMTTEDVLAVQRFADRVQKEVGEAEAKTPAPPIHYVRSRMAAEAASLRDTKATS